MSKLKKDGTPPNPEHYVFVKQDNTRLTREEVSKAIKEVMVMVGIPAQMASSHSLRRGGASYYAWAGKSNDFIARFGRWTSDTFKEYTGEKKALCGPPRTPPHPQNSLMQNDQ